MEHLACDGAFYTIRAGETLAGIAHRLNVTPGALLRENPYVDPRTLAPGTALVVPPKTRRVFVRYGQTLGDLLMRYNLSYQAFCEANPGYTGGEHPAPGSRVWIPPYGSRGAGQMGYAVLAEGETLSTLAAKLRRSPLSLLRENPNLTPEDFAPGRVVRL